MDILLIKYNIIGNVKLMWEVANSTEHIHIHHSQRTLDAFVESDNSEEERMFGRGFVIKHFKAQVVSQVRQVS